MNTGEEKQEFFKPKTPAKTHRENANSPLSFSMSAIQMTDSKTFNLSDFGCEFLNKPLSDSTKNLKSSGKSSSLTRILNYESRKHKEEETVIRKKKAPQKAEKKSEGFFEEAGVLKEKSPETFTVFLWVALD